MAQDPRASVRPRRFHAALDVRSYRWDEGPVAPQDLQEFIDHEVRALGLGPCRLRCSRATALPLGTPGRVRRRVRPRRPPGEPVDLADIARRGREAHSVTSTKRWHPADCTCFGCLERMADPNCAECEGDGYIVYLASTEIPGASETEEPCKCTEEKRMKKMEKAGMFRRSKNQKESK